VKRGLQVEWIEISVPGTDFLVDRPAWYWRIRWENGRKAATSELYTRKATCLRLAQAMADHLGCPLTPGR
jgi:hypothetical protein